MRNGKEAINFGANDYLGLAWHPELREAAAQATERFGSGAAPLVAGGSPELAQLSDTLARFEATEAAIVFSSGYAANVGAIAGLASREDILFSDSLNHASLIDGCRLSRASVIVYPHNDLEALSLLVSEHRHRGRFAFVVTDSVFSMDGDTAPLDRIMQLCDAFDMHCICDEAHATGVFGQRGRGLAEHLGIHSDRLVCVGTLSKAVGCMGGFVTGSKLLIDWLTHTARSWIYSTAPSLPNLIAANRAIELIPSMHQERASLQSKSAWLRNQLIEAGLEAGLGTSPIIPIYLRDPHRVLMASRALLEQGFYVPAIRPPTVPKDSSLLRISLSCHHTEAELEQLINALRQALS